MTGLERIAAAVHFEEPDRVPVVPQVFGHAARLAGVPLREYLMDGGALARCQLKAVERYDHDVVFSLLDAGVETEALGSRLRYPDDAYPWVERHALEEPSAISGLRVPNPRLAGRMPVILDAARTLRRETGGEVLVTGCVVGPMTLATQLLGAERALFAAVDEPEAFELVLDFGVEVALVFGEAQMEAGVHVPLVFEPSASPAVVPPAFFREMLAPRLRRLLGGLKAKGSLATWLHIAGPVEPILPHYRDCSVDIGNVDYCVGLGDARCAAPGLCLEGNIRPLAFVDSEPEAVAAQCSLALETSGTGGFLLSSGCEIPIEARPECVDALVTSVRTRGR